MQEKDNNGIPAHWCPRYESGDKKGEGSQVIRQSGDCGIMGVR